MTALVLVAASYYASRFFAKDGRLHFFHGRELSDVPDGGSEWQGKYTREFMILCLSHGVALVSLFVGVTPLEWVLFAAGNQAAFNLCRGAIKRKQPITTIRSFHV